MDFAIHATDGTIGKTRNLWFDQEDWTIRYLVVSTGNWLKKNEVLVSPIFIKELSWAEREVYVSLTREQVKNSPPLESRTPISRKQEMEFYSYYRTPNYWAGYGLWGTGMHPEDILSLAKQPTPATRRSPSAPEEDQVHLRSTQEISKYRVFANRGEVGKIEDFIFDDRSWAIRYMVVAPAKLLPGRKVLLSPSWTEDISWKQKLVFVDIENSKIEDAPSYDPEQPVTPEYEEELIRHYKRPATWK
jgi:sporulation protein YlmC with PRC-barrel domain